ncbi:hypothetical protein SPHINGOAX6_70426 [Sphingomonas sp. AX6]|nr:hypothetical protein SPHINGOAX6_70426 [Sphingomonas sp. AX6]
MPQQPVHEAFEVGIDVEQRRDIRLNSLDPIGQYADPGPGGHHDRRQCHVDDGQEQQHAEQGRQRRRHAAPLQPFEDRHQRDGDDQRGGGGQEEGRAALQRKGQRQEQPDPADQCDAREQPVSAQFFVFAGIVRRGHSLARIDQRFAVGRQFLRLPLFVHHYRLSQHPVSFIPTRIPTLRNPGSSPIVSVRLERRRETRTKRSRCVSRRRSKQTAGRDGIIR